MDFIESLFYMIWRGIAIGILISAPMGPVGILCIQRTLDKGRRTGFYTGVGAALSDLFYCLLTGFGLSFIEEFLERNQNVIQLVGSAVLIGFGVYLFKKNPATRLKKPVARASSPKKDILTGFLFTFSNPLILFLSIGLFARFNFLMPGIRFYHYIIGYAAIFAGALGWWWLVTYFVDKVRAHFNLRSMYLINRVIGAIILLFALVGIVTGVSSLASAQTVPEARYWNKARGYAPFSHALPDGLTLDNKGEAPLTDSVLLDVPMKGYSLSFRATNIDAARSGWGLFLTRSDGSRTWITVTGEEKHDGISSRAALKVAATDGATATPSATAWLTDGADCHSGPNIWRVEAEGRFLALYGGNRQSVKVLEIPSGEASLTSFGFTASPGCRLRLDDITLEPRVTTAYNEGLTVTDRETLCDYLDNVSGSPEGIWAMFDRTLEEDLLRQGGDYTVAIVKAEAFPSEKMPLRDDGRQMFLILYLSGARVNAAKWKPGMLKGTLTATPFNGIYDAVWIDAEGQPLSREIKAQTAADGTLGIQFPYQSSAIRLRRVDNPAH